MDIGIFASPLMPRAASSMLRVTAGATEVIIYTCTPTGLQTRRKKQWALAMAKKVGAVLSGGAGAGAAQEGGPAAAA